ncbi:hypothetical protein Tco_0576102 [Tanacetum coccineum]
MSMLLCASGDVYVESESMVMFLDCGERRGGDLSNLCSLIYLLLDDLEEMDLKWQLALLSMRARKYYQKTGKKITINGSDTAGYDKSKVECFNCHKMGRSNAEVQSSLVSCAIVL